MYFILVNDNSPEFNFYINAPDNLPREIDFISGDLIKNDELETPLVFTTDATTSTNMLDFRRGTVTLMSKKCFDLFKGAGVDNLQIFPAIIKSETDGTIWDGYFAVNVLGLISCADLSRSTYTEIMPGSYRFRELAIHPEKAKGALLFRLQEDPPGILMHRNVGKYIIANDPDETMTGWEADDIIQ